MLEAITAMFSYTFLTRALVVGLLISLCAALLGVSLVLKRYAMIGDGLSHVGFGALALAAVMNWAPLVVAVPVVIIAAFFLLRISESRKLKGDSAIALISTSSLAIGVMAVSLTSGMNTDVNNYLFGSILAMSDADVILSVGLSVVVLQPNLCGDLRRKFCPSHRHSHRGLQCSDCSAHRRDHCAGDADDGSAFDLRFDYLPCSFRHAGVQKL
mgnify:CR=1 FL=1